MQKETLLSIQEQRAVIEIQRYTAEHGFSPTIREIAQALGLVSASAADYHLRRLEDKGVITRQEGKARTIRIVQNRNPQ